VDFPHFFMPELTRGKVTELAQVAAIEGVANV